MALFRYPGKKTWWYEFHFAGQKVRESAKICSKEMARRAENARRRDLEESHHGLKKRTPPRLFSVAADEWLTLKKPTLAARSVAIEEANLKHLLPVFGKLLITDIDGKDISRYQQRRLENGEPGDGDTSCHSQAESSYGLLFSRSADASHAGRYRACSYT